MAKEPKFNSGQSFKNYTIDKLAKKVGSRGEVYYNCTCICGEKRVVRESNLGVVKGCGCDRKEPALSVWRTKKHLDNRACNS